MSATLVAAGLRAAAVIVAFAAYALSIPHVRQAEVVVGFDAPLGDERRPETIALTASRIRGEVQSLAGGSELSVEPPARDALRFVVSDVDGQQAAAACERIAAAVVARSAELLPRPAHEPSDAERALARYVAAHPELDAVLTPPPQRPQRTEVERTRLQIERAQVQAELDRAQASDGDTDNPFAQRAAPAGDRTVLRRRLAEIDGLLSAPVRSIAPAPSFPPEFIELVAAARPAAGPVPEPAPVRARVLSPVAVLSAPPTQGGKAFVYLGLGATLLAAFLPLLFGSETPELPTSVELAPAGAFALAGQPLALPAPSSLPLAPPETSVPGSRRASSQSSNPPPRDSATRSSNPPPRESSAQSSNPPPRESATRSSNPPPRDSATRSSNPPPRESAAQSSNPPPRESATQSSNPPPRESSAQSSNPPPRESATQSSNPPPRVPVTRSSNSVPAARLSPSSGAPDSSLVWAYPVAWQADPGVVPEERTELAAQLKSSAADECLVVAVVGTTAAGARKSLVAAAVAQALALDVDARVLLLEGDFARPSLHRILHMDSPVNTDLGSQLSARVAQAKEGSWYVVKCSASLHVLPCLQPAPDLLLSTHFESCVKQLQEFYDFIIINGPSVDDRVGCRALNDVAAGVVVASRVGEQDRTAPAFTNKRCWFDAQVS